MWKYVKKDRNALNGHVAISRRNSGSYITQALFVSCIFHCLNVFGTIINKTYCGEFSLGVFFFISGASFIKLLANGKTQGKGLMS